MLEAANRSLQKYGYAGLSTRRVAEAAGMPLSQIHYHFGSKDEMVLQLLAYQNEKLLRRQSSMYDEPQPLWKRWDKACDYLDDDLASGYVRLLQEMLAAGWSNPAIARAVRELLGGWFRLLTQVAGEAEDNFGALGSLKAIDVATLVGSAFIGAEAMLLLGIEEDGFPLRRALRRIGALMRSAEERREGV